jgi:hypothetical protein
MTGRFRRAIRLRSEPGRATAEVEDDFHHFAVTVLHDGQRVTDAAGQAVRYPWSQCPMAVGALPALAGLPLTTDATAVYRHLDPLGQCTHMLEIAGLAITQSARGLGARRYDVSVTDPVDGRTEAELLCDGEPLARWVLQDGVIVEPPERAGERPAGFRSNVLRDLPHAEAEMLLILRRALGLAGARGLDVDRFPTAAAMDRGAACFVFRPGVAERARRRYGSERDFSDTAGPLPETPPSGDPP